MSLSNNLSRLVLKDCGISSYMSETSQENLRANESRSEAEERVLVVAGHELKKFGQKLDQALGGKKGDDAINEAVQMTRLALWQAKSLKYQSADGRLDRAHMVIEIQKDPDFKQKLNAYLRGPPLNSSGVFKNMPIPKSPPQNSRGILYRRYPESA